MKELVAKVKLNREIAENIYAITLTLPEDVGAIECGQFLNLSTGDKIRPLKRPLGIVKVEGRDVTVCYQLKGEGTRALAATEEGQSLNVLLPLGNGFKIPESAESIAIIGGGVGVFPLISVLRKYKNNKKFYSYIGFRNKAAACLLDELEASDKLTVVTDDGSLGEKDNAVNAFFKDKGVKADIIIACGPPVMLRALKAKMKEEGVKTPCLVSLEERMGCGIGACLVCVCKKSDGENARVCKDGPVFDIWEVEL